MTCKDCIHYEACNGWISEKGLTQYYCDNGCDEFSDKSEWVHLPCKVNDIVYSLLEDKIVEGYAMWFLIDEDGVFVTTPDIEDGKFGEYVFFTKEEAEKALAERKEK